jgi:hypothetical protein
VSCDGNEKYGSGGQYPFTIVAACGDNRHRCAHSTTELLPASIVENLERAYRLARDGRSAGPSSTIKSEFHFRFDSTVSAPI